MAASIPASEIVKVLPGVISAGGTGLDLVGLLLTNSTQAPIGSVLRFATAADVSAYFGPLSAEAGLAITYFDGYVGSTIKPAQLLVAQYPSSAVAAYLRGGSVAALTLSQLQALTGTLTITVNGTAKTSSSINLSSATSFSNAATIIQAAFSSPGFVVSYDSISGAFVFTDSTTGATATMSYATGTLAAGLKLTAATGAVVSAGADAASPATFMEGIIASTQNFVSFSTAFKPQAADMVAFAAWAHGKGDRYAYVAWDNDAAPTTSNDTTSVGYQIQQAGYSGTVLVYDPTAGANVAAFVMGCVASIDFNATKGRITAAFKSGDVSTGVSNATIARNLKANGYNFVGAYATANDGFVFFYPGQITGKFDWLDAWVNQVWMNNGFQLALMTLLTSVGAVSYDDDGKALIEAALQGQIDAAINFGAVVPGITLSPLEIAEINNAAGRNVADTVQQRGWYVLVGDAAPSVRAARTSPPVYFWYTDGGAVQQITLNSVLVQ